MITIGLTIGISRLNKYLFQSQCRKTINNVMVFLKLVGTCLLSVITVAHKMYHPCLP